ncbi:MAG: hypothetical protein LAO78_11255 [Acidobacteriia bacterium]|nr:hypothetical protein [Terriglobia bacterium]
MIFEAERLNTEENAADAIEMIDLWLGFPDAPDDKAWCEAACGRLDELSKDSVAFPPESGLTNHDLMMLVMELRGRCFVMYLSSHVGSKEVVHRARRHATLIILLKPDDPHFLSIAARIFALIDDVPTALNTVGRALAINPKHQESLETKRLIGTLGRGNE